MYLSKWLFNKDLVKVDKSALDRHLGLEILSADMTLEALDCIKIKKLPFFDTTTGDQWCEARSSLIINIFNKLDIKESEIEIHINKLVDFKRDIYIIRSDLISHEGEKTSNSIFKLIKKDISQFLQHYKIESNSLSEEIRNLTLCYFLKKHYSLHNSGKEQIDFLVKKYQLSPKLIRNTIKKSKKIVNDITDSYVNSISWKVLDYGRKGNLEPKDRQEYEAHHLILRKVLTHNGLKKRATYPGMKIILAELWIEKIPIIINVRVMKSKSIYSSLKLIYVSTPHTPYSFNSISLEKAQESNLLDSYCFSIEAVSCFNRYRPEETDSVSLSKHLDNLPVSTLPDCQKVEAIRHKCEHLGVERILEYNTVIHSQYLDESVNLDLNDDVLSSIDPSFKKRYKNLKKEAQIIGCCSENMEAIRVYHIYPDLLKEAINRKKSTIWAWHSKALLEHQKVSYIS
ncbi:hypothetical protein [Shewanella surugensis]|uniref:Uncharacterized protein n=1 Tax=Shewanella surugensis TaxID=212020 RepID=A0ABT0LBS5_9GAMM|nr:hypothetical protein [Shewanella surugensis]MCL1125146.1 hypothetical protein [Shewanella surugensis]